MRRVLASLRGLLRFFLRAGIEPRDDFGFAHVEHGRDFAGVAQQMLTKALLGEPTLDGLVNTLEETQIEWAAEPADHLYAAAAVDFTAQFPTAVADPDTLS